MRLSKVFHLPCVEMRVRGTGRGVLLEHRDIANIYAIIFAEINRLGSSKFLPGDRSEQPPMLAQRVVFYR